MQFFRRSFDCGFDVLQDRRDSVFFCFIDFCELLQTRIQWFVYILVWNIALGIVLLSLFNATKGLIHATSYRKDFSQISLPLKTIFSRWNAANGRKAAPLARRHMEQLQIKIWAGEERYFLQYDIFLSPSSSSFSAMSFCLDRTCTICPVVVPVLAHSIVTCVYF